MKNTQKISTPKFSHQPPIQGPLNNIFLQRKHHNERVNSSGRVIEMQISQGDSSNFDSGSDICARNIGQSRLSQFKTTPHSYPQGRARPFGDHLIPCNARIFVIFSKVEAAAGKVRSPLHLSLSLPLRLVSSTRRHVDKYAVLVEPRFSSFVARGRRFKFTPAKERSKNYVYKGVRGAAEKDDRGRR